MVEAEAACPSAAITREYFSGHGEPVICVGFVENSSLMVSLDRGGQLLTLTLTLALTLAPTLTLTPSPSPAPKQASSYSGLT